MNFGHNAKIVFRLIQEIIAILKEGQINQEEKTINASGLKGLSESWLLAEIADKFILPSQFKEEKLFDLISDAYNQDGGLEDFIEYKEVLMAEKLSNFQNMIIIFNKREKLKGNKKSPVL